MSEKMYDELALKREIQEGFGVTADVSQAIVFRMPVSHTAEATLFMTNKKQLYLYVTGKSKILLSDIKTIIARMGLKSELFIPPKGRPTYFEEAARSKFIEVFPGRKHVNDEDLMFYRTLVPYNPALVLISEVKNGEVYRFDSDAATKWRVAAKFAYRRIRTS